MVTFKSYITGYILSLGLVLGSYFAVTHQAKYSIITIFVLAIIQVIVQLVFFLEIDKGPDARWNMLFFGFALLVIGIFVGGSLWIMNNLNYNMTSSQMNASMLDQAE